jgi:hemerythrin
MSVVFIWSDEYSVGDQEIDNQHKRVFELANSIPDTWNKEQVMHMVMKLFRHTREHFTAEETLMKATGYPQQTEHMALHDRLITKLSEIAASPFENEDQVGAFKYFVYEWVIDHILNHDRKFFRFVQTINAPGTTIAV